MTVEISRQDIDSAIDMVEYFQNTDIQTMHNLIEAEKNIAESQELVRQLEELHAIQAN